MTRFMSLCLAGFLAAGLILPAATVAKSKYPPFVEANVIKDKPTVALDMTKGFVLLRSDIQTPILLMKVPSAADQAQYDAMRAEAFAEATAKYQKKMKSYERDKKRYDFDKEHGKPSVRPEKPIEPTEANFDFTAFGLFSQVSIGPLNRFAKASGGASQYLHALTPGTYRVYGLVMVTPGAATAGSCFCMGSIQFDVAAGEITDLGAISVNGANGMADADDLQTAESMGFRWKPASQSMVVDPRLGAYRVASAKFRPIGKLPNYFGVVIDRIPEMEGIMRYDRDRIIDLTAP